LLAEIVSVQGVGLAQGAILAGFTSVGGQHRVVLVIPVVNHRFGLFRLVLFLVFLDSLDNGVGVLIPIQVHDWNRALMHVHVFIGEDLGGFGLASLGFLGGSRERTGLGLSVSRRR